MNKKNEKKQEEVKNTKKSVDAKECKSSTSCKKAEKKYEFRTLKYVIDCPGITLPDSLIAGLNSSLFSFLILNRI